MSLCNDHVLPPDGADSPVGVDWQSTTALHVSFFVIEKLTKSKQIDAPVWIICFLENVTFLLDAIGDNCYLIDV